MVHSTVQIKLVGLTARGLSLPWEGQPWAGQATYIIQFQEMHSEVYLLSWNPIMLLSHYLPIMPKAYASYCVPIPDRTWALPDWGSGVDEHPT